MTRKSKTLGSSLELSRPYSPSDVDVLIGAYDAFASNPTQKKLDQIMKEILWIVSRLDEDKHAKLSDSITELVDDITGCITGSEFRAYWLEHRAWIRSLVINGDSWFQCGRIMGALDAFCDIDGADFIPYGRVKIMIYEMMVLIIIALCRRDAVEQAERAALYDRARQIWPASYHLGSADRLESVDLSGMDVGEWKNAGPFTPDENVAAAGQSEGNSNKIDFPIMLTPYVTSVIRGYRDWMDSEYAHFTSDERLDCAVDDFEMAFDAVSSHAKISPADVSWLFGKFLEVVVQVDNYNHPVSVLETAMLTYLPDSERVPLEQSPLAWIREPNYDEIRQARELDSPHRGHYVDAMVYMCHLVAQEYGLEALNFNSTFMWDVIKQLAHDAPKRWCVESEINTKGGTK